MSARWLSLVALALCAGVSAAHAEESEDEPPAAVDSASPPALQPVDHARLEQALERAAQLEDDEFCRKASKFAPANGPICAFSDAAQRRCPAFRKTCLEGKAAPSEREQGPGAWTAIVRLLGYLLMAGLIGLVLFGIVTLLRRLLGGNVDVAPVEQDAEPAPATAVPGTSVLDRNVQRRLAHARELAAQGNYAAALTELHAGVVLALDARGLIEARKGRTNGDYSRELAEQPELSSAFRDVARAVESVQFGARAAERSLFEWSLERASALIGPTLLALTLVLSFALSGCSPLKAPSGSSAAAACGTGAKDHSFLCSALEETHGARRRYRRLTELSGAVGVVVIVADELSEKEAAVLASWVDDGGVAVLSAPIADFGDMLGYKRDGAACTSTPTFDVAAAADAKLVVGQVPTLRSSKLQRYIGCGEGIIVGRATYGDGAVVLLSDPALFSNASLAAGSNAELLLSLIPTDSGPVEIVGDWTGRSADSPFASLRAAGLLPWLAHLGLLGLALARYRGTPFARRHPLIEDPRRRFAEHVEALGDRWADARASRVALAAYAAWALDALHERTSGSAKANLSELAEAVARRSGTSADAVLRTLAKARLAKDGDDGATETEQLQTLRELSQLIAESGGSRWT